MKCSVFCSYFLFSIFFCQMTTFGAVMLCRRILDLQNKRGFNSYDVCRHEKKRKEKKASIVQLTLHRLSTTLSPLSRRDPAKTDKNNTRRLPAFAFHAKPGEKPSFNSYVCCRTKLQVTQKSSSDRRVSGVQLHLRMCNMALIFMIFFVTVTSPKPLLPTTRSFFAQR